MARSQTARLELNNPYAKYGLKRRSCKREREFIETLSRQKSYTIPQQSARIIF